LARRSRKSFGLFWENYIDFAYKKILSSPNFFVPPPPPPQKKMLPPEKKPYFRGGRARLLRVCHRFIPPHSTSNGYFTTFETSLEADYQKSCFDAIFDSKKFGRFPYQKNKFKKQHEK
jgi:hypothetical protein